jgi:uncharacterized coiled-coil DUF342 family protein
MESYQDKIKKLSKADRIHNLLITYAYNTADSIRQESERLQRNIADRSPSSAEVNKCLLMETSIDDITRKLHLLSELQEMSVHLYRVINKHDKL